jgi:hypothetical protein
MPDVAESLKPNTRRAREPARSPAPDSPAAVGRRTGAGWSAAVATRRHPESAAPEPIDRAAPHGIARCALAAAWRACAADALTPLRRTEGTDSRWSPSTARCTSSAASRTNRTAQPIIRALINVIRALIAVIRTRIEAGGVMHRRHMQTAAVRRGYGPAHNVARCMEFPCGAANVVNAAYVSQNGVWDTVPCGIPCRVGYRAVWDTVPCGIPCRVGYRAVWDTTQAQVQVLE